MRIVGGRWRGRSLATPKSDAIRPTSDRLRESLFNVLQHGYDDSIEGARVLDLFAGTGALGLEALSRGAAFALFVDEGSEARSLIRQNVETFGAGGVDPVVSSRRDTHGASRAQRAFLAGVLRSALRQRPGSEGTRSLRRRRLALTRRIGGGGRSAERERHAAGGIFRDRAAGIWGHAGGAGKVSITSGSMPRKSPFDRHGSEPRETCTDNKCQQGEIQAAATHDNHQEDEPGQPHKDEEATHKENGLKKQSESRCRDRKAYRHKTHASQRAKYHNQNRSRACLIGERPVRGPSF